MKEAKLNEGVLLLSKLAAYLDEMGDEWSASRFRSFADELKGGLSRKELIDVCRNIHQSTNSGPGRITDYYLVSNGKPDVERTHDYADTIRAIRRFALGQFARRSVLPWSLFSR
jgi:hypothetical protein